MAIKVTVLNLKKEINDGAHHKDKHGLFQGYKVIDLNENKTIIDARFYYPATVCYVCVWLAGKGSSAAGSGRAGGGGYHKPSAALQMALQAAGVEFDSPWGGRNVEAEAEALEVVAYAMGYNNTLTVKMVP